MKLPTAQQFGKAVLMTAGALVVINRAKNYIPGARKLLGE